MPSPCPLALIAGKVPQSRWTTRTDLSVALHWLHRHISAYPEKDIQLERTARLLGMAPERLSRLFHQTYGVSMRQFRKRKRMERSYELLQAGASVTDASIALGYQSLPSFSREFKSYFGKSPSSRS